MIFSGLPKALGQPQSSQQLIKTKENNKTIMKTKARLQAFHLGKKTISNLDQQQLNQLKGGLWSDHCDTNQKTVIDPVTFAVKN